MEGSSQASGQGQGTEGSNVAVTQSQPLQALLKAKRSSQQAAAPAFDNARQRHDDTSGQLGLIMSLSAGLLCIFGAAMLIWTASSEDGTSPSWIHEYQYMTQRTRRPDDLHIPLEVTLADLHRQAWLNVSYQQQVVCGQCLGSGALRRHQCEHCHGNGYVAQRMFNSYMRQACPRCGGHGQVVDEHCHHCRGRGVVMDTAHASVLLSAGLRDGDMIRLVGEGTHFPNTPPGDLVLTIHEQKEYADMSGDVVAARCHSISACFERNDDLEALVSITLKEALLGWKRSVTLPSGSTLEVGSASVSQPGDVLVLPGVGMRRRSPTAMRRSMTHLDKVMELQSQLHVATPDMAPAGFACGVPFLGRLTCPVESLYGALRVIIQVSFPEELQPGQREIVRKVFGGGSTNDATHQGLASDDL